MARILLSHAAADRPRARRLAEGLRRAGHQPWLIEDEVRVARSVLDVLHDGLHDSDVVVTCLSEDSLRSGWQEAELRIMLEKLSPEQTAGLIAVRLDDVALPSSLQGRACIDVRDAGWDEGLSALSRRLTDNAAHASLRQGAFLGRQGAWESAQQHLERALRISKQAGNELLLAEAYRLLGDATLHGSLYEDARLNYTEAIWRYDALGLLRKAAKARLLLLTLLLQLGRCQEANALKPLLRKALADGFFTDAQERADVELALRLADTQSRDNTP